MNNAFDEVSLSPLRVVYLEALELSSPDKAPAREKALERAHDIRKFEIELYWKRANYFWLLQAAVFAALGFVWKIESAKIPACVPVALCSLGIITASSGFLSSYGSKFWQRNWEHHIDMLETEFEGNLHKTVYLGRRGVGWSLTGINESMNACFAVFWLLLLIITSFAVNPNWTGDVSDLTLDIHLTEIETIGCWFGAFLGIVAVASRGSELKGVKREYPGSDVPPLFKVGRPRLFDDKKAKVSLVRRKPDY